jgi:hypothetical protein
LGVIGISFKTIPRFLISDIAPAFCLETIPYITELHRKGLLEHWIENDLSGRINP